MTTPGHPTSLDPTQSPPAGAVGDLARLFDGPAEESLSEAQRAQLDQARLAFRELEKLIKNTSLYGQGHQTTARFRGRFYELVSVCLAEGQPLEVILGPYTLSVHHQVVYENQHPERNFVYKFYVDGIRRLIFLPGVQASELDDLLDTFLVDWEDPALFEDDAVTLLWSKSLTQIEYTIAQTFDQDTKEDEEFIFTVAGVVAQVRHAAPPMSPQVGAQQRAGRAPAHPQVELTLENLEVLLSSGFALHEADLKALGHTLATDGRETLEKFLEILFKVRLIETDPMAIERTEQQFDRMVYMLLDKGRIGDLERLLRKLQRLRIADLPGDELGHTVHRTAARATAAVNRLFSRWAIPRVIDVMVEAVDNPQSPYTASALAVLLLLSPHGAVPTLQAIARTKHKQRRGLLIAQIGHYVGTRVRAVAPMLGQLPGPLAHALLEWVSASGDERALAEAVQSGLQSADQAVRLDVLSHLPPAAAGPILPLIFSVLEDGSRPLRARALFLLAQVRTPEVYPQMFEHVTEEKTFGPLDLEDKRRYFAVLALSADAGLEREEAAARRAQAIEWFTAQLEAVGLLSRKNQDELAHCAAVALALLGHREAVPLFERALNRRIRNELVYAACHWALQHMGQKREQRTQQIYDLFLRGKLSYAASPGERRGA